MSEELKACPVCKSNYIMYGPISGYALWHVVCQDCGMQVRGRNKYETINLWNTRPIEDGLRAELAALTAERDAAQAASDKRGEIAQEYYLRICNLEGELAGTQVERNNARAEVERLRGIIRTAEYADRYGDDEDDTPICPLCGVSSSQEHQYFCPFYQWEGGAK